MTQNCADVPNMQLGMAQLTSIARYISKLDMRGTIHPEPSEQKPLRTHHHKRGPQDPTLGRRTLGFIETRAKTVKYGGRRKVFFFVACPKAKNVFLCVDDKILHI